MNLLEVKLHKQWLPFLLYDKSQLVNCYVIESSFLLYTRVLRVHPDNSQIFIVAVYHAFRYSAVVMQLM